MTHQHQLKPLQTNYMELAEKTVWKATFIEVVWVRSPETVKNGQKWGLKGVKDPKFRRKELKGTICLSCMDCLTKNCLSEFCFSK